MHNGSHVPEEPTVSLTPSDATSQSARGMFSLQGRFGKWLLLGCVIVIAISLYWIGPQAWALLQDEQALEAWVISLGWMGPLALVALNAIQIVVAPIPGYVLQFAAGFLFGPVWGGVWGSLGLLLGASLAFWLTRVYGRPLAGRLVGDERLDKWQRVSHSHSTLVWFIILLSPTGDIPYFLAGLARVSFIKILVMTIIIRVPSAFVVAAAGAGVVLLTWWQVALLLVGLSLLFVLFLRYQEQIMRWTDRHVQRRVEQTVHHDAS
jgi:uncharacterized membrane protein YdjX (TVP38/TMEM64 family)